MSGFSPPPPADPIRFPEQVVQRVLYVAISRRARWLIDRGEQPVTRPAFSDSAQAVDGAARPAPIDPAVLVESLVEQSALVLFVVSVDPWRTLYVSRAFERVWGRPREVAYAAPGSWTEYVHEDDRQRVREICAHITATLEPFEFEYRVVRPDGSIRWVRDRIVAGSREHGFLVGMVEDITDARRADALLAAQRECLEHIARGRPVAACLDLLTRSIEAIADRTRASVLLLDADTGRVRHASAPSLPDEYARAIDGLCIGPRAGSCGTAMHRGERVVVSDIATDPLWDDYRELADRHGLVACWSQPIIASDGRVLGTFALYPSDRRGPSDEEIRLLESAADVAAIALERAEATGALERRVRQSLRDLRAGEERFRSIVQSVPGAVYRCEMDRDWTMRFLSDGAEILTGYPADEFIDSRVRSWASVIVEEDRAQVEAAVERAVAREQPFTLEYRVRRRDGEVRWVYEQGRATYADGGVLWLDGVILDVTVEREMQEAIRESERRFRVLADQAPMMIWLTRPDGTCEFCNRAWSGLTGRAERDLTGPGWLDAFAPADRARLLELVMRQNPPAPFQLECRLATPLGDRTVLIRGAPRADSDAEPLGYVGVASDITDLREAQRQARERDAQLARAEHLAAVGEMASALAHELNQPLAAISNFATGASMRAASGELASGDLARILREIAGLAQRGGALIHRVREQARGRTPAGGWVRPAEAVERAWRSVEHDAARVGVRARFELDRAPQRAPIDGVQLEQIIVNLLRNAIDELAQCPHDARDLAVSVSEAGGRLRLEVRDTGRGLQLDADRLFQPFQTSKAEGMGLGLAITRSIVESHGGRIAWTPAEPTGSCFTVELPLDGRGRPEPAT